MCKITISAYTLIDSFPDSTKQLVDGLARTNGIESVWAVLKRGFYGIYHSFSTKHLQRYLDECAFRLNETQLRQREEAHYGQDRLAAGHVRGEEADVHGSCGGARGGVRVHASKCLTCGRHL